MKYRKKPVVIEAMHYTVENCRALHEWAGWEHSDHDEDCENGIVVETLEGTMRADLGDWIIRGVKGEFYPCKPDVFEATYEPVELGMDPEPPAGRRLAEALREIRDHGKTDEFPCHDFAGGADCVDLMQERARAALAECPWKGKPDA